MKLQIPSKFNPLNHPAINLTWHKGLFKGSFEAMASDCSLLIELPESELTKAKQMVLVAVIECWRIEFKYSRYHQGNFFCKLHSKPNEWVSLDEESQRLLDFADKAWHLSNGLFDISSGILRQVWQFKPNSTPPKQTTLNGLLANIGWHKVKLDPKKGIKLPPKMELDFGGIGKEYAVDKAVQLLNEFHPTTPVLVNFGGDIACNRIRGNKKPWLVGIEMPNQTNNQATLSLSQGAIATSGDSKRYILHQGKRYSHVLNPKTGWSIDGAPGSVTVSAPTCIQAGLLATLSLLQGQNAESYIKQTGFNYWLYEH